MIELDFAILQNFLFNFTSTRQALSYSKQGNYNNCYMMEVIIQINFAMLQKRHNYRKQSDFNNCYMTETLR